MSPFCASLHMIKIHGVCIINQRVLDNFDTVILDPWAIRFYVTLKQCTSEQALFTSGEEKMPTTYTQNIDYYCIILYPYTIPFVVY